MGSLQEERIVTSSENDEGIKPYFVDVVESERFLQQQQQQLQSLQQLETEPLSNIPKAELILGVKEDNNNMIPKPSSSSFSLSPVTATMISVTLTVSFLLIVLLQSNSISDQFLAMTIPQKLNVLSRISWFPGRFTEAEIVVSFVLGAAAFAQALTGFGFAIVAVGALSSMPWLLHSELYEVITPVAATLGSLVGGILLLPSVSAGELDWDEILPLAVPCALFTPMGIKVNGMVDPVVSTKVLAVLVLSFVAYQLLPSLFPTKEQQEDEDIIDEATASSNAMVSGNEDNHVIEGSKEEEESFLSSKAAAYLFGAAAGISGGAFDVQGPPLVVYGNSKKWEPQRFRNTILAVVALNSALIVAIDYFTGTLGDFYYSYFCITSLPGVLVGVAIGERVSEIINPAVFKKVVLGMCIFLGFQLLRLN